MSQVTGRRRGVGANVHRKKKNKRKKLLCKQQHTCVLCMRHQQKPITHKSFSFTQFLFCSSLCVSVGYLIWMRVRNIFGGDFNHYRPFDLQLSYGTYVHVICNVYVSTCMCHYCVFPFTKTACVCDRFRYATSLCICTLLWIYNTYILLLCAIMSKCNGSTLFPKSHFLVLRIDFYGFDAGMGSFHKKNNQQSNYISD